MLHLQEKAHFSLDEFRRGKGSPLTRYNPSSGPITPDADDDELSVLGGKTRLVSKKEPSSPILMERSPVSQNPIVPLPLSPGLHSNLPESVREYLDSFKVQGGGGTQQQQSVFNNQSSNHNSFSNSTQYSDASEISPVSMYGMSTLPTSFQSEPSSFLPQQSMQNMMQTGQGSGAAMDTSSSQNESNFPQYFPVYDYGLASSSSSGFQSGRGSGSMFTQDQTLVLDTSPAPSHRKASGSPEGHSNMQSTWLDFVNTMAMQ